MGQRKLFWLIGTASVSLLSAQAFAQTATGQAPEASQEDAASTQPDSVGDIVVTARKTSESLQRAAAAIDVVSSRQIEVAGVTDVRAVQFLLPSARLNKQQSVAQMFIRGVGIASDAPSLDMGVAMTFNGIEQFREATGSALFDIERVEVLRGPQATTYGSNAAGGVINVVFAKPTKDFSGKASVEYGNYNRLHVSAAQNLPLSEKVQLRFAADYIDRDSYSSNGLDDQETLAGRVTLAAQPSETFNFNIWGSYYTAGGVGDLGYASPFVNPDNPWKQSWNPLAIVTHFPGQAGRNRNIDLFEVGGEFNLDLGGVSLTYIPGYAKLDHLGHLVIDTGAARILFQGDVEREQITQELRLRNNDTGAPLQWLAGFYYYHLDTSELRTVAANRSFNITDQPSQTVAGYAQLTYKLTDALRATGGLRYSKIDKSITGARFTPGPATSNPTPIPFSADLSWNHVDWKAGVEFDVSPSSMAYASVQTGYLGGGVNFFNSPSQSNEVKPEKLLAYLIGMKSKFADGRIRFNWEAFYYDWKNYQVGLFNVSAGTNIVFNAPKSESYGIEFDSEFRISSNDRLNLSLGLFHGEFKDFTVPAGISSPVRPYNFAGYDIPFAPKVSVNASYERKFDFADGSNITATGTAQYTSKFWTSFSHGITRCASVPTTVLTQDQCVDRGVLQPEAVLVNLDLTWHSPDDRWNLGVWARNITKEVIRTSGGDGGMNALGVVTSRAASTLAPPRTFGVRAGVNW